MDAGQLKVTFGALDTAAGDIQGSANQIQGRLDQLDSELAPLRADWTGQASEAYQTAKAEWTRAMTDMQALLAQVGSAVTQSNSDYQSAERTNQSRW
jgi:WXG100 family type VII secretion target